ncbi:MAG: hypothetical protein AMJ84_00100 [Acidithiobacillales bacterium SM23_46]|nr:MAG: hypothetical protein AMJ84_00100 [Acidithiobacillales bacterium SM23_46]KPL28982.1 MAG: hypothetical protein AMJ72_00015 [Acidithiobacillales bacterium SM1_46]
MLEYALWFWLVLPGGPISAPVEIGVYRTLEACEAEAARQADADAREEARFGAVWRCVERPK